MFVVSSLVVRGTREVRGFSLLFSLVLGAGFLSA